MHKSIVYSVAKTVITQKERKARPVLQIESKPGHFVVAFCGSGTGHLTQTVTIVRLLRDRGMVLAGVITDDDASERMLEETVRPLGVDLLILPAIPLVKENGMVPPLKVLAAARRADRRLLGSDEAIRAFFGRAAPSVLLNFWHPVLGRYLQSTPLPEGVTCLNVAAQFGLCQVPLRALTSGLQVATKATIDAMAHMFGKSGHCVPISPTGSADTLAPIIEVPRPLAPAAPKLVLCYFLIKKVAAKLDALVARGGFEGVEFHCFTATALPPPKGRPLAINSHPKQRALFQELFARCTGVMCSAGNETIWEAVCRGVPVLAIPTAGHGEQLCNGAVHARNLPQLVRARPKLKLADVRWLVDFEASAAAKQESEQLRGLVADLPNKLAELVPASGLPAPAPEGQAPRSEKF
jgi:hypothetical protein